MAKFDKICEECKLPFSTQYWNQVVCPDEICQAKRYYVKYQQHARRAKAWRDKNRGRICSCGKRPVQKGQGYCKICLNSRADTYEDVPMDGMRISDMTLYVPTPRISYRD